MDDKIFYTLEEARAAFFPWIPSARSLAEYVDGKKGKSSKNRFMLRAVKIGSQLVVTREIVEDFARQVNKAAGALDYRRAPVKRCRGSRDDSILAELEERTGGKWSPKRDATKRVG